MNPPEPRPRNAAPTRDIILTAATHLFAAQGFAATGMQDIATAAGVARATPSYFFGSKALLWRAVMDAQATLVADIVPGLLNAVGPHATRDTLRDALLDRLLHFHQEHRAALRLIQWAELQERPAHQAAVQSTPQTLQRMSPVLRACLKTINANLPRDQ